jgi:hypothetical protein
MDTKTFAGELCLEGKIISVTRKEDGEGIKLFDSGCNMRALNKVFEGETIVFDAEVMTCPGAPGGFGFSDEHEYDKESKSIGTQFKYSPDVAYESAEKRPQKVMEGYKAIEVKLLEETDNPDVVSFIVNPDQLVSLIMLFSYRHSDTDTVIAPFTSGCASMFRLPFGELRRPLPRAVVGAIDSIRLSLFPDEPDKFFFTVSSDAFKQMKEDADRFFESKMIWTGLKNRIKKNAS